jgi:hypothetical protein
MNHLSDQPHARFLTLRSELHTIGALCHTRNSGLPKIRVLKIEANVGLTLCRIGLRSIREFDC